MNILTTLLKYSLSTLMLGCLIVLFGTGMKIWWLLFSLGWNVL